jgi:hypothetical protein
MAMRASAAGISLTHMPYKCATQAATGRIPVGFEGLGTVAAPVQQAPRLDWLYYFVAGSTVIGALTLSIVFAVRPPNRRVLMLSG